MNYNEPWLYAVIAGLFLVLVLLERLGPVSIRQEITSRLQHLHHSQERLVVIHETDAEPAPEPPAVRILPGPGYVLPPAAPAVPGHEPLLMPSQPTGKPTLLSDEARTEQLASLRADCEYCGEDHVGDCEKSLLARALRKRGVQPGSIAFEKALGRPAPPGAEDTIPDMKQPPEPRPPVRVRPGEQVRIELPPPPAIPEIDLLGDYDPDSVAARIRAAYERAEADQQLRIDEAAQLSRQVWAAEHPPAG